jgi:hypothetical protein
MGILRWLFGSSEPPEIVRGTKVLVAYVDDETKILAEQDAEIYAKYYPKPELALISGMFDLSSLVSGKDVFHLVSTLDDDGTVRLGSTSVDLNQILRQCSISNVKLLWLANLCMEHGFTNAKAKPAAVHLVVTIDRRESLFGEFLDRLLGIMSRGISMPVAWVKLVPQYAAAPEHKLVPGAVFIANRGQIQLLP